MPPVAVVVRIFHKNRIKLTTGRKNIATIPRPGVHGPLGLTHSNKLIPVIYRL